jgi:hypothetical protein
MTLLYLSIQMVSSLGEHKAESAQGKMAGSAEENNTVAAPVAGAETNSRCNSWRLLRLFTLKSDRSDQLRLVWHDQTSSQCSGKRKLPSESLSRTYTNFRSYNSHNISSIRLWTSNWLSSPTHLSATVGGSTKGRSECTRGDLDWFLSLEEFLRINSSKSDVRINNNFLHRSIQPVLLRARSAKRRGLVSLAYSILLRPKDDTSGVFLMSHYWISGFGGTWFLGPKYSMEREQKRPWRRRSHISFKDFFQLLPLNKILNSKATYSTKHWMR